MRTLFPYPHSPHRSSKGHLFFFIALSFCAVLQTSAHSHEGCKNTKHALKALFKTERSLTEEEFLALGHTEAELKAKIAQQQTQWLKETSLFTPVKMQKFTGGFSIKRNRADSDIFLSDQFLKLADTPKKLPPSEPHLGHTYRYSFNPEVKRGSGRDHLIHYGDATKSLEQQLESVKGSGTNPLYGATNGEFNLSNFRRNGLQDLPESLAEFIMSEQYAQVGIPIVPHTDFILLPESLQLALDRTADRFIIPNTIAIQTRRILRGGRESQSMFKLSDQRKADLVGDLLTHNVGHGAINPENLSGMGELLDMGHTGFGMPFLSYQYRCTVCTGIAGSRYDGAMIGPLDHFFTSTAKTKKALSSSLSTKHISMIYEKLLKNMNVSNTKIKNLHLDESDLLALKRLFKEEIAIDNNRVFDTTDKNWGTVGENFLDQLDREFYGKNFKSSEYFDDDVSRGISTRFAMQVGYIRNQKGAQWFKNEVEPLLAKTLKAKDIQDFDRVTRLFANALGSNKNALETSARVLFTERRPMNILMRSIEEELKAKKTFASIEKSTVNAYKKLSAPIRHSPNQWWKKFKTSFENALN